MLAHELAQPSEVDLEPGDKLVVEVAKGDDGVEEQPGGWEWPVGDAVIFGFGRVIAVGSEVVAYKLDTLLKEVTFVEFQGETVADADSEDTLKVVQDGGKAGGGQQDVVDDDFAGGGLSGGVLEAEQGIPFAVQDLHQGGVDGGGVAGSKGHDSETVFAAIRGEEGKFLLIALSDPDLVVTGAGVQGDEEEGAIVVTKVVDGVVTTGDGVGEGQSDGIQFAVADAHAPNELIDVLDMLLVRLWCKHHHAAPGTATCFDPVVVQESVELLHDDFALMGPVVGLRAADRLAFAGVKTELVAKDALDDTGFVESIPMALDDHGELAFCFELHVGANTKVFVELIGVSACVPHAHVIARGEVAEDGGGLREGCPMTCEEQDAVIEVKVDVIGLVSVFGLGAPELGRHFDGMALNICGNVEWGQTVGGAGVRQGMDDKVVGRDSGVEGVMMVVEAKNGDETLWGCRWGGRNR